MNDTLNEAERHSVNKPKWCAGVIDGDGAATRHTRLAWTRLCLLIIVVTGLHASASSPLEMKASDPQGDPTDAATGYSKATSGGELLRFDSGLAIRVLVDASTLGGDEVEVAVATFPADNGGNHPRPHRHGSVELFYILSGRMDHVVNGVSHVLEPGMVGIVRPGDLVIHRVLSTTPVKALVIWAPGGELGRIRKALEKNRSEGGGSNETPDR